MQKRGALARNNVKDLTQGNAYRLILVFTLPILLSQIFQQLYNTVDALVVGRFLGTNALAAVSSSFNLIFLLVSLCEGLFMGAGVVISRYFGAGDRDRVSRAIHTDLAVAAVSGIALTLVGVFFSPVLLRWMNTDPDVMPEAVSYFRVFFAGSIPLCYYNCCRGILNAVGDSKRPLYYLILSSLLNIVLDLLFLAVFGWGVWSAAFATILAQGLSCALCFAHLFRKGEVYTVELRRVRFHRDMLREILRYGLPSAVQNSVIAIANVVVQSQINLFGKYAMAAYGVHCRIEGFAFLPITSFCMAATTYVGQNLGARQYGRAKQGARFIILMGMVVAQTIGVCYYLWAPDLIGLFDSSAEVIFFGSTQARISTLAYTVLALSHIMAAVCRGAGKAYVPMFVMLGVWCVFRLFYIMAVVHLFHDIVYIYWAYPLTWVITGVIFLLYYLLSDWVHGFEHGRAGVR